MAIFGKFNERSESKKIIPHLWFISTTWPWSISSFFIQMRLYCSSELNFSLWNYFDIEKKKKTVSCRIIKEKRKKFERSFSLPRYRKRQHRILTWYQHGIKHLLWCISESLGLLSTQRYLYRGTITWRTASWNGSMSDA